LEEVAQRYNSGGWDVYDCVSELVDGANQRCLETVKALSFLHVDIDLRSLETDAGTVLAKLKGLPCPLEIRDSGGGYHVIAQLKEPVEADSAEYERANKLRTRLRQVLAGDPMPDHAAALLRRPGTKNFKYGEPRLCHVIQAGASIDLTEVEDLVDLLGKEPLFVSKETPKSNGHGDDDDPPQWQRVEVDAALAAMRYHGGANGVRKTQLSVTASLLLNGMPVEDIVTMVIGATREVAEPGWDWHEEDIRVRRMTYDWFNKRVDERPDLVDLLPEPYLGQYRTKEAAGETNIRVKYSGFNGGQFNVSGRKPRPGDTGGETGDTAPNDSGETEAPPKKYRFPLIAFQDMRPGLEPAYLVDELVPSAGLVLIWGKQKTFKSFWLLDLCLHIAMGWTYRDRAVRQGTVLYCAFEGAHGFKSRIEAQRRFYCIADDTKVPLYIMPGQADLINERKRLVTEFKEQLSDIKPILVVLDTLNRSLVGSESKDVDMTNYTRAAEGSVTPLAVSWSSSITVAMTTPTPAVTLRCRRPSMPNWLPSAGSYHRLSR
jgi:hypothetical protein